MVVAMVKSLTPTGNMGVYKRLDDVPDRYRLANFAAEYDSRDTWAAYVVDRYVDQSEYLDRMLQRFERRWKAHMAGIGRHHALATPGDIEAFCTDLVERNTLSTAYETYWLRLEDFYQWLQAHPDHPHVYQPVLMAAAAYPNAATLWKYRITRTGVCNQ